MKDSPLGSTPTRTNCRRSAAGIRGWNTPTTRSLPRRRQRFALLHRPPRDEAAEAYAQGRDQAPAHGHRVATPQADIRGSGRGAAQVRPGAAHR